LSLQTSFNYSTILFSSTYLSRSVSKAESSEIFQKSLETPALTSATFAVTKGNFYPTRNEGFRKFHDREGGSFILGYGKGCGNSYSPRC